MTNQNNNKLNQKYNDTKQSKQRTTTIQTSQNKTHIIYIYIITNKSQTTHKHTQHTQTSYTY